MYRSIVVTALLILLVAGVCSAQSSADSMRPLVQGVFPNPFTDIVQITVDIPSESGHCRIAIFDVKGQLVGVLFEGQLGAGISSWLWNGTDGNRMPVLPGVYVVVVAVDGRIVDMEKAIRYPMLQ